MFLLAFETAYKKYNYLNFIYLSHSFLFSKICAHEDILSCLRVGSTQWYVGLWEMIVNISGILWACYQIVGSLKSAVAGVFYPIEIGKCSN